MQFFVFKKDLGLLSAPGSKRKDLSLDGWTSVARLKGHFFDCLRSFGEIIPLDEKSSRQKLAALFKKPGVVFVRCHSAGEGIPPFWNEIPKRTLAHSLGTFLLPTLYHAIATSFVNTIWLVTTDFQMKRLKKYLGKAAPPMAVFTPRMDEESFFPPTRKQRLSARKKLGLYKKDIHIVYSGRWLATKGICQLARIFKLWPLSNVKITLVGAFNPSFPINYMSASHFTFADYFQREFILPGQGKQIRLLEPKAPDKLREILWGADIFTYPSVHEDENFGMAPREAALCGVPVVATDFCGLHPLVSSMPWGGIATYPTFSGPRFSLYQFRKLMDITLKESKFDYKDYSLIARKECNQDISRSSLKDALGLLLKMPLEPPLEKEAAEKKWRMNLFGYADERIPMAFAEKKERVPEGALVDGTGTYSENFPYRKFLQIIQGFYTTMDKAPSVKAGWTLRGFFRIALWKEEKRLVEFGFPGPRMKRYNDKEWGSLISCVKFERGLEITMRPLKTGQVRLAQELVDLGYIVPDQY